MEGPQVRALHRVTLAGALIIAGCFWTFGVVLQGDNETLFRGGLIWAVTLAAALTLLMIPGGRR